MGVAKSSNKKTWLIYSRYYDPKEKEQFPKGKLRIIKGMNDLKDLSARQIAVRALISTELNELQNLGYNPISLKHEVQIDVNSLINPHTPFIQALKQTFLKAKYNGHTYSDIKSVLKYVDKAAVLLRLDYIAIKDIKPSHMMLCRSLLSTTVPTQTSNKSEK